MFTQCFLKTTQAMHIEKRLVEVKLFVIQKRKYRLQGSGTNMRAQHVPMQRYLSFGTQPDTRTCHLQISSLPTRIFFLVNPYRLDFQFYLDLQTFHGHVGLLISKRIINSLWHLSANDNLNQWQQVLRNFVVSLFPWKHSVLTLF